MALFLAAVAPTPAFAAVTMTQDALSPTSAPAGLPVTATLNVHSSACATVRSLGVAVRDAKGTNLDFPGSVGPVTICPSGYTLTTGARSFAAGTYSMFGFYQDAGGYHNFPAQTLTVGQGSGTTPGTGQTPVWSEEFTNPIVYGSRWRADTTSAFRYGNHNPDDDKLDWLNPAQVSFSGGIATFTAKPSTHTLENGLRAWDTGLLTTEGTSEGFRIRTGDYVETRVKLPTQTGAWPALWTWRAGDNEIDTFEHHVDNPNLLELSDHINQNQLYWNNAQAVVPGQWVTIGVYYGSAGHDWYVNGVKVYPDHTPSPPTFNAYLILNLSVVAGKWHPAPTSGNPITFSVDYVRVYR
ncbi:hypothetical protein AB0C76_39720 [Kitasatospora sp. NPDC048722]|uniref:glycoside hydrolase family 16 protein n=1 Tax=Kitasatospora sp. NPDC048722 TaxID=3155639 RepID=UPI003401C373